MPHPRSVKSRLPRRVASVPDATVQLKPAPTAAPSARDRILHAAEVEFAEHGRGGSSVRAIAQRAGCAQSLIHHYFPTKEDLWMAVGAGIADAFFQLEAPFLDDPRPDHESIRRGIRLYWRFWRDHPTAARIYLWRLLEGATPESLARDQRHHERSAAAFERAQAAGTLRTDLPAPMVMNILAGAILHFCFHGRQIIGETMESEDVLVDALMRLVLAPTPPVPSPPR